MKKFIEDLKVGAIFFHPKTQERHRVTGVKLQEQMIQILSLPENPYIIEAEKGYRVEVPDA